DGCALLVPQHRHGDAAGVIGLGSLIDFIELRGAVDRIGDDAGAVGEGPAVVAEQPVDGGKAYHRLQALELAKDQRAMRPGTGEADIEMIAPGFGAKAALPRRPRRAV